MADAHNKPKHDYHLVDPSPWPAAGSLAAFVMAVGAIMWMHKSTGPWLALAGFAGVLLTMFFWWRDVINEAHHGDHTPVVQLHLRYGMILFIASEVMFFLAWFWGYFDGALYPNEVKTLPNSDQIVGLTQRNDVLGGQWPPVPIDQTTATKPGYFKGTFDPWGLPLVNTLILLTSGTTVTWAHHALLNGDRKGLIWGLTLTVILGVLFTACQAYEYMHASFSYAGHLYGSTFFMATGFHGFHVLVGTIFLAVCLLRALKGHFTPRQHFGFEAAAWYWHFVDVVWLFLFACIYVWGAGAHAGAGH
jgi:cytochrome c oxidase subunit 3